MIEKLYEQIQKETGMEDLVFGEGNPNADIMLIGEAPGKDEVAQKKPFVGKAGKNLSEFLERLSLLRKDIFITNAVKFRPTKISEKKTVSNRTPTWKEVMDFRPYLMEEISMVEPAIIVTLGNTPLRSVFNNNRISIGDYHGKLCTAGGGCFIFALYHPASIIYNRALGAVYDEDLLKLKDIVENLKKTPKD